MEKLKNILAIIIVSIFGICMLTLLGAIIYFEVIAKGQGWQLAAGIAGVLLIYWALNRFDNIC